MILWIPPERETRTNLSVLPVIVLAVVEGLVLNLLLLVLFLRVLASLFTLPIVVWVIFFLLRRIKIMINILASTQFHFDVFAQTDVNLTIGLLHTMSSSDFISGLLTTQSCPFFRLPLRTYSHLNLCFSLSVFTLKGFFLTRVTCLVCFFNVHWLVTFSSSVSSPSSLPSHSSMSEILKSFFSAPFKWWHF